ncbi:FmdB family zinc ribbon protein [Calycomorphotria hydatis]|uniref:FmdB family zinc ribbon protein n=1 Tax=Calycomorphotria hydatis TaxID=2528027 RepID=UPI0011A5B864|nr:zinc ribbon domain-containing protein [Calycomorphotria hydatis]
MPLFEFRCDSCHSEFEQLVRGKEETHCPQCSSKKVSKLLSAPAAHVKGSLPITGACPPPEMGPCGTGCCRLPQ